MPEDIIYDKYNDPNPKVVELDDEVLKAIQQKKENIHSLDKLLQEDPVIEDMGTTDDMIRAQRIKITGFPLDHFIICGDCEYEGKVGFRQTICPKCHTKLIAPEKAGEPEGYYERKPRKTSG